MTSPDAYGTLSGRRRTAITAALLACVFLAMLDGTVVGTALPRITTELGGDDGWYLWLVTAYLLTSSAAVPAWGRYSDLYGRRPLLIAGLTLFLAGSFACGCAQSMPFLIAARAVQGLGGGSLLVLGMAVMRDLYPPDRAAGLVRMQTALAAMMVLGMVGGPLVGGLLADNAGWRWAFWLNLPVGAVVIAVLAAALPPYRAAARPSGRLDATGMLLLAGGISLVLVAFSIKGDAGPGHSRGWTDPAVAGSLLTGLLLLAVLVPVERRAAVPVLPLRLFGHRAYASLLTAGLLAQLGAMPVGILLPLYFQHVRDHSATVSGLLLLPYLIGMTAGNRITAAVVVRQGRARPALFTGAVLLTAGTLPFLALGDGTPMLLCGAWLFVAGLGTGPFMGGLTIATQSAVPPADMGTATAGAALAKQLGGACGLACAQSLAGGGTGAASAGAAVAWTGGAAGLLAIAVLLAAPDVPLAGRGAVGRGRGDPGAGRGRPAGFREAAPKAR
ncbi:MFS transporter [Streptomyces sp. RFCAC02]|uniref:MFS transporter n=1 Tax=Streptomyces sp. RFCAC02 TaxID=2499143 RepID=UPI00101FC00E|nr:MFS transporter [Streptomyces sp. RFCAC02]